MIVKLYYINEHTDETGTIEYDRDNQPVEEIISEFEFDNPNLIVTKVTADPH